MALRAGGLDARVRSVRDRLDHLQDAVQLRALRQRLDALVRRIGLTRTGQVALVAAVVPWIVARVVAGTALYLFAYGTIVLVLLSLVLAPRRLRLRAEREGLFPRAQEGDRLEVRLKVRAAKTVTSFQIEERVPEELGAPVRVPVARVRGGEEVVHTYSLQCARRGAYTVGPLIAIASDPVGVSQRETVLLEPFELLVHPRVTRVVTRPLTRLYEDPPIRPPVSKPWPSGLEFYGMREFRRGDDLRRIVWRASARTGRIMVREAEQGITDHITLVLDTDRGSHSREGTVSESFETGVRAAASIGVAYLRAGYEVRCEVNARPLARALRGPDKTLRFLDLLARLGMDRVPLLGVLRRLVADPARDAQVFLITPKLTRQDAALLKLLVDKGVSLTVVALLWNPEDTETLGTAATLGCQVAGVHMGQDLGSALAHDIGAGNRL